MARDSRNSYDSSELPQGAVTLGIVLCVLAVGVFLIVRGLV